jgi:putative methionine-R-sulfoxide reductase with GAF domain
MTETPMRDNLAGANQTRSQIVIPNFVRERAVGEIDVDGNPPGAFGSADRELIESVAQIIETRALAMNIIFPETN